VIQVSEIFGSIQGESTAAGRPCAFVRVSGCNLRCRYCDTRYAWEGGRPMSVGAILDAVANLGLPLVEITGGEPLAQPRVSVLIEGLLEAGYEVMLETNGSLSIEQVDERVKIVMDVKTPGSGESARTDFRNFEAIKPDDDIKFVVTSEGDYIWARSLIYQFQLQQRANVLISAAYGDVAYSDLAAWMIRDRIPARLNLQLQKQIWSPTATGV